MSFAALLKAWLLIVPVMIANGIFRELVLRRIVGPFEAEVISLMLGIAIIIVMTRFLLRPLAGKPTPTLTRASVTLVLLTVAFEFLFGRYVDGRSWRELAANYAIWDGALWPIGLAAIAIMPFVWGHWALPAARHAS